mmetsp:Transcript_33237/g.80594  ORF Transcript_33237/g.80594 Transcript_33237/m.80594 type:complete len:865 (+) Transcript_33237:166-2760(+)
MMAEPPSKKFKESKKKTLRQIFEGLDNRQLKILNSKRSKGNEEFFKSVQGIITSGEAELTSEQTNPAGEWKSFCEDEANKIARYLKERHEKIVEYHLPGTHTDLDIYDILGVILADVDYKDVCDFVLAGWKKYLSTTRSLTVKTVIEELYHSKGRTSRLSRIKVKILDNGNSDKIYAYYLPETSSSVNFRHEGDMDKSPDILYLEDLSTQGNQTLLYYSASGSGKTAEIAGSSASRDCHLTVVLKPRDGDGDCNPAIREENENTREEYKDNPKKGRNIVEIANLLRSLKRTMYHESDVIEKIINAATDADKLKLVIAIDEASNCPNLLRSLISDRKEAVDGVVDAFSDYCDTKLSCDSISVVFSVAGTGASAAIAGSDPKNYRVLQPTFSLRYKELTAKLLSQLGTRLVPGGGDKPMNLESTIDTHLPVVSVMMENGRMASIACASLREHPHNIPIDEKGLVEVVATKFIKSNGLKDLEHYADKRYRVAAAALAVHLFQGSKKTHFPQLAEEYERDVQEMNFAVTLASSMDCTSVLEIVSRFGLLEPNTNTSEQEWKPGKAIEKPFVMTASHQIMALYLLGVGMENMLEGSPFGFETLSTHLVKCAVASSLAVAEEQRPCLQNVFQKIGFRVCPRSTHADIKKQWNKLGTWKAVGSACTGSDVFLRTRQLQAELVIETKSLQDGSGNQEVLSIEKLLQSALKGLQSSKDQYCNPLACINYGNSPFADGYITFHVIDFSVVNGQPFKFTIMNQSKDYHTSSLDVEKLEKHAEKGENELLGGIFGHERLLCVSSSEGNLIAKRQCSDRKFLPYCVDQSHILRGLLGTLTKQRNREERQKRFTCFCDKDGNAVQVQNDELEPTNRST